MNMKIATWNVNSLKVRLPQVLDWLAHTNCDVLCLQETKMTDELFPASEIEQAGYYVVFSGQKTYNGVAIMSKHPITQVKTDVEGLDDPQRRIMMATVNGIRIVNLYVVNGKEVGTDKYDYKLNWLAHVSYAIEQENKTHKKCVVVGDFNIAPKDEDVHNPMTWQNKILCSQSERDALNKILSYGFVDAFREYEQADHTFSWWDYRSGGFEKNKGLRIDLILNNQTMQSQAKHCYIDIEPRKNEQPSDHAPVVCEYIIEHS